jgi:hypothetical protein
MRILALLRTAPGRTMTEMRPLIVAEEIVVWDAYRRGVLREMALQNDPLCVALFFEAPDKTTVSEELSHLPMMKAGLLDAELIELGPWWPLEALFGPQAKGG